MVVCINRRAVRSVFLALCLAAHITPALVGQDEALVETVPSPDGSKVAIVVDKQEFDFGEYEITIQEYSAETKTWSAPRVLGTAGYNWHPRWSPDSSKLTFTSYRQDQDFLLFDTDVFVINVDGTNEVNVTNQFGPWDGLSDWSPDGSKLTFFSNRNRGNGKDYELWIANSDGSSPINLGGLFNAWGTTVRWFSSNTLIVEENGAQYIVKSDGSGGPILPVPNPEPGTDPPPSVVLATLAPRQPVLSPLALASVFRQGIASSAELTPSLTADGRISTELLGRCVKIGSEFAPILAVTGRQINFQVPAGTPTGPNTLTVFTDCSAGVPKTSYFQDVVNIARASPGFFRYTLTYVAARFQDGSPVAPAGFVTDELGRKSKPAKAGDVISIYGTGWGPTTAPIKTGEIVQDAAPLLPEANPQISFGGIPLPAENLLYIGAAPGAAGLYQLNMVVPPTPGTGDRAILLSVYGSASLVDTVIAVE